MNVVEHTLEISNYASIFYEYKPWFAMINRNKDITDLQVPSNIIINASIPTVIIDSGQIWNKDNDLQKIKYLIPDRFHAIIYEDYISYQKNMGSLILIP